MKTFLATAAIAASLACPAIAYANLYKVTFTASYFNTSTGMPAPQSAVTGSILFTTVSSDDHTPSVKGIDLIIGSHRYTVDEIGSGLRGGGYAFGGLARGIDDVTSNTDDFYLDFGGRGEGFGYSTAGVDGIWATQRLRITTEEIATVPEPGSVALVLIGAAGALARRRSRRA